MDTYSITQLSQVLHQSEKCIRESDALCVTKATEILVFVIADLDRLQISDIPQAVPIAYALKGYSMSVELMRRMLYDVLEACANRGLYTPIVSFDGQWSTLAMRSTTGKPLTILQHVQMQKDVWRESKATNKSAILKHIFKLNVVKFEKHAISWKLSFLKTPSSLSLWATMHSHQWSRPNIQFSISRQDSEQNKSNLTQIWPLIRIHQLNTKTISSTYYPKMF